MKICYFKNYSDYEHLSVSFMYKSDQGYPRFFYFVIRKALDFQSFKNYQFKCTQELKFSLDGWTVCLSFPLKRLNLLREGSDIILYSQTKLTAFQSLF